MKNTMSYKEYTGTVEFNEKECLLFGRVLGTQVSMTYSGFTAEELVKDFHNVVDNYLKSCQRKHETPERPFKGSFNVRVSPYIHKESVEYAMNHDISLNTLVNQALRYFLQQNK